MPISGGKYVAPLWVDNAPPALGATELQAMSDSVASYADPVAHIPWLTRPNLLDNWYFVGGGSQQGGGQFPINQRGSATYSLSAGQYTIDRWYTRVYGTTVLSCETDNLTITSGGTGFQGIIQSIGNGKASLAGKTVTLSALITHNDFDSNTYLSLTNGSSSAVAGTYLLMQSIDGTGLITGTVTVPTSLSNNYVNVVISINGTAGKKLSIVAVKLELGDTQTLAHQENGTWVLNEIPNFDEQFMRCATLPGVPTRIEHGSYTGTGTYGSANPNALTFGFVPKTVIIYEDGIHVQNLEAIFGCPYVRVTYSTNNTATPTWDGSTTFQWYASSAMNQMNSSGVSYYYIAIG